MDKPDNKQPYLIKILTMLVRRNKGSIRIPAQELMTQDIGNGIRVWWDESTKELVLDHQPSGAKVYVISEERTWLTNEALPQQPLSPKQPLNQDELISRVWTDSAGTPTNAETLHPPRKNQVSHLTDLSMAAAEMEKRKAELLKELSDHPGQRERSTRSPSPTTFFKS